MLSASRLALAPLLGLSIWLGWWKVASVLFAWAVVSDVLDGRLAREQGTASARGGLLDHGADAATVASGCLALGFVGAVPQWLFALVALAFLQYASQSRVRNGENLKASQLGRLNGIAYYVLVGAPVLQRGIGIELVAFETIYVCGWVLVVSTLASMGQRAFGFRSGQSQAPIHLDDRL